MEIVKDDIILMIESLDIPFVENSDLFEFTIDKRSHAFKLQFLKDGQYIFIGLIQDGLEYQIEHLEYYMNETKDEMLEELNSYLTKLKTNESRVTTKKCCFKSRYVVELLENGSWSKFGLSVRLIKRQ